MLCGACKKKEAIVHLTVFQVGSSQIEKMDFCPECAAEKGAIHPKGIPPEKLMHALKNGTADDLLSSSGHDPEEN
jgi:protein-arginine kinase activator protein McsA